VVIYDPKWSPNNADRPMDVSLFASAAWGLPWVLVGKVAEGGADGGKEHILCLRPVYMRSLFDLPLLEALYEARVGFDAGPVSLYKGKRELV